MTSLSTSQGGPPILGKRKILVVDNHPVVLKFMGDLLTKNGCEVMTAADGLTALTLLGSYVPDVIYVDLIMPNISGEKLCWIIRRTPHLKDIRIVILSSVAAEQDLDLKEIGANACIAKGPLARMAEHVLASLEQESLARPEAVLGIEDIHPRQITRELLSVKRHFEAILGSMSEAIFEVTPELRIVYTNEAALTLTGMPEEKLIASSLLELFGDEERERLGETIRNMDGKSSPVIKDAVVNVKSRQALLTFLLLREEEPKRIIAILTDVTERRRMEEQFMQAQKLEAIGTLAGGIAHDFNNALTGVTGNLSIAMLLVKHGGEVYRRLEEAESAADRARELAQQLLTFARGGEPVKKMTDLVPVVKRVTDEALTGHTVRAEFSVPDDLWPVEIDEGQMMQAFNHLMLNAVQAMHAGGTVHVQLENVVVEHPTAGMPPAGRYVKLTIEDQGIGIPAEDLPRIFDPYFTTRRGGAGLGLTVVYSIIMRHNGFIAVDSKLGAGTTVRIYLPACAVKIPETRLGEEVAPAPPTGKILVMDDEAIVREVAGTMLEHLGYCVEFAREGSEAIRKYKRALDSHDPFDAVIIDLTVSSGLGGVETIRGLRELDPGVRAIVSSGYANDPVLSNFEDYGFHGVVAKPYKLKTLSDEMGRLLNTAQR